MAGPVTMSLGSFAFEALGFAYEEVARTLETPWAESAVAQRFDVQQWTGPRSDEVTIKGVLFPIEFGGAGSLEGIRQAAISGTPLMLASLGGRIYGNFTVQRVTEDRSYHDRQGAPAKNAYQITIKAYDGNAGTGGITLGGILSLVL